MPALEKKLDHDHSSKFAADLDKSVAEKREALAAAIKSAPATSHAAERKDLLAAQAELIANKPDIERQRSESIFAAQRDRLEQRQRGELALTQKALDAAGRLAARQDDNRQRAKTILDNVVDAIRNLRDANEGWLRAERAALETAFSTSNIKQRDEQTGKISRIQTDAAQLLTRDIDAAIAAMERREALAGTVLTDSQREQIRSASLDATKNEKLRGIISARAIQELADEALCPGRASLETLDERAAIQRVKGAIAEQIALAALREEVDLENQTRPDRTLFVIEGERIRDETGKKLSDGIAAWRDKEGRLQIWKAIEVKAGRDATRDLVYTIEKLTKNQDAELRKLARDLANDRFGSTKDLTLEQGIAREMVAAQIEEQLRSRAAQKESGQREQTTERLDLSERMYVDGIAQRVAIDRDRRLQDIVKKVTVDEARRNDLEMQRLGVLTRELDAVAKAFVEELLHQRNTA